MAAASASAPRHAAPEPDGIRCAATSAARSAAAWARCRAMTAAPSQLPPTAMATKAATMNAASTLAAPDSSPIRLRSGNGFSDDDQTGKQCGPSANPSEDEAAVPSHFEHRGRRSQRRGPAGGQRIAASRQSRRFPSGVDTTDLHRQCSDTSGAQDQNSHQRRDGQGRFDRTEPAAIGVNR